MEGFSSRIVIDVVRQVFPERSFGYSALEYYVKQGFISPKVDELSESTKKRRFYSHRDIMKLACMLHLKDSGVEVSLSSKGSLVQGEYVISHASIHMVFSPCLIIKKVDAALNQERGKVDGREIS